MPTESPTVGRRSPAKAPRRRIGIDVGGTNTDAVLLEDERVLHAVKTPTTPDVTTGVRNTLAELLRSAGGLAPIGAVMLGTTHFTNAVVQHRELTRVAADRKSTRLNSSHRCISYAVFCFVRPRDLPSFPTRRSSDLRTSASSTRSRRRRPRT